MWLKCGVFGQLASETHRPTALSSGKQVRELISKFVASTGFTRVHGDQASGTEHGTLTSKHRIEAMVMALRHQQLEDQLEAEHSSSQYVPRA